MFIYRPARLLLMRLCAILLAVLPFAHGVAPTATAAGTQPDRVLSLAARLQPDGTLDTTQGNVSLDPSGYKLSLGAHGEPHFTPAANPGDEGWDDRFGTPGVYDGDVGAAAVSENGDLYVGGSFYADNSSVPANHIARWDGRRWYPLGEGVSGGLERVRHIATHGANVYVAGEFTHAGGVAARQLARWDGAAWSALGNGMGPQLRSDYGTSGGTIYAVAVAPNGDVYVGGNFNYIDDTAANGVARWDGTQWQALGAGLSDRMIGDGSERFPAWVYALAVAPDGSLYAGGQFSDAGDVLARNIARWDGTQWQALGTGVGIGNSYNMDTRVEAIAVDGTTVYAGGLFNRAGTSSVANVARWNGSSWQPLGAGLSSELDSPSPVLSLLVKDGALYAGGTFTSAGGKAATAMARWDGAQWSAFGTSLTYTGARVTVQTLAPSKQGGIFAGGVIAQAGGVDVYGITHWNGERWESLGQGVALVGDMSAQVNAVAVDAAGRVYVGGFINTVGGMHVNNIAMWDGTRWHDVGGGVSASVDGTIYALLAVGDDLYVGGQFTQAGGKSASRVAKWNSTSGQWSAMGAGIDDTVYALTYGDGVLYAGGSFKQAGDASVEDVAAWDGTRWQALGGDYEIFEVLDSGNEAGTFVRALAYANGGLFIGGHFQTIHRKGASTQDQSSYAYVHNVIMYEPGTQHWLSLGAGGAIGVTTNGFSGFGTTVYALAVVNNGLYIGGTFNRGGGLLTPNLARWDLDSGAWSSPGVPAGERDVNVSALAGMGNILLIGGSFTSMNDAPAFSMAALDTATGAWNTVGGGIRWRNGQARVTAAAITMDALYLGGEFSQAGPHPSIGFAQYHGDFPAADPDSDVTYRVYLPLTVR